MGRVIGRCFLLALSAFLSACASIDFDYPRPISTALTDTGATQLARKIGPLSSGQPSGHAGFHLLPDGVDALSARLSLAARAQRSIDLQYYLIKNDPVGRALIHVLLQAADRGVRVRLLLKLAYRTNLSLSMSAAE